MASRLALKETFRSKGTKAFQSDKYMWNSGMLGNRLFLRIFTFMPQIHRMVEAKQTWVQ